MSRLREKLAAREGIGKSGIKSEKRVAKKLGGKLKPASGAISGMKGDFDLQDFLVEAKSTTGDSLGLKFDWLAKIKREAREQGKEPALTVSFILPNGKAIPNGDWVLIQRSTFERLTGE